MSKQGVDPIVKLGINMLKAQIEVSRRYCGVLVTQFGEAQGVSEKAAAINEFERVSAQLRNFQKQLRELEQEGEQS